MIYLYQVHKLNGARDNKTFQKNALQKHFLDSSISDDGLIFEAN